MTIVLHGISNCDTVKRARAWLAAQDVAYEFHDFKKAGLSAEQLRAWQTQLDWQRLVNRSGSTWRKLGDAQRAAVLDADSANALMLEYPSIVKRPVVRWADGRVSVGFDAADWLTRLRP